MIKISSAIPNADDIIHSESGKVFRFNLKQMLPTWVEQIEELTKETMELLIKEDSDCATMLIKFIDEYSNNHWVFDEDRTALFIFYAKIKSALNDVMEMDEETFNNSYFACKLRSMLFKMASCIESQFKYLMVLKDQSGTPLSRIVDILDENGKLLMFLEKE